MVQHYMCQPVYTRTRKRTGEGFWNDDCVTYTCIKMPNMCRNKERQKKKMPQKMLSILYHMILMYSDIYLGNNLPSWHKIPWDLIKECSCFRFNRLNFSQSVFLNWHPKVITILNFWNHERNPHFQLKQRTAAQLNSLKTKHLTSKEMYVWHNNCSASTPCYFKVCHPRCVCNSLGGRRIVNTTQLMCCVVLTILLPPNHTLLLKYQEPLDFCLHTYHEVLVCIVLLYILPFITLYGVSIIQIKHTQLYQMTLCCLFHVLYWSKQLM